MRGKARDFGGEPGVQFKRARPCEPTTDRWRCAAPLGFDAGDANLYRYVRNRPTNATDPSGQELFAYGTNVAEYLEKALGAKKHLISGSMPPPPYDVRDIAQAESGLPLYVLVPTNKYSEATKQGLGNYEVPLYEAMYSRQAHMIAWRDKAEGRWWHSRAVDVYGNFTAEQREQVYQLNLATYGAGVAMQGIKKNMPTSCKPPDRLWGEWKVTYCECTKENATLLGHAFVKLEKNDQVYTVDLRPGQNVEWCAGDLLNGYTEPTHAEGLGNKITPRTYFNPGLCVDFEWTIWTRGCGGTCYDYARFVYLQKRPASNFWDWTALKYEPLGGVWIKK